MAENELLNKINLELKKETEDEIYNNVVEFVNVALESKYYEREYDGDPYDSSGILKDTGKLNKDFEFETVGDLLEQYTGDKEASYADGMGWNYLTFKSGLGSGLEDVVESLVFDKLGTIIKELITNKDEKFKNFIMGNDYSLDDYNEMLNNPEDVLFDFDLLGIDYIWEIKNDNSLELLEDYYEKNLNEFILLEKLGEGIKNLIKETRQEVYIPNFNISTTPISKKNNKSKIGYLKNN